MKYTCDCINSLFFDYNCVKCGCSNTGGIKYIVPFDGNNFDIDRVFKIKKLICDGFEKGIVYPTCKRCYMLREVNSSTPLSKKNFERIYLSHWYHCNCACIYCTNQQVTKLKITSTSCNSEYYDLLPTIKYLTNEGYIGENTKIYSIGGEPTILSEYDGIINELAKYSNEKIFFLSNGIEFSETIYKFLKRGNASLIVSLDCGTSKMFKKIKHVDSFDKVIKNVEKYNSVVNYYDTNTSVELKYILIDGLNDKMDEIKKFIEIAKKIGIKKVFFDINRRGAQKGKRIPKHWYKIFEYCVSIENPMVAVDDYCKQILNRKVIF